MTEGDVLMHLAHLVAGHPTQSAAARELGVSPQYLVDCLKGRRQMGSKILRALQLRKVVSYERVQS